MKPGKRNNKQERGAVLAITLVLAIVLFILSTSLFVLFNANVNSYEYTFGRLKAITAAESGVSIALYQLAEGHEGTPVQTTPYSLPGDSAQWINVPGSDEKVWIVIDPYDANSIPNIIGGAEIRCRGLYDNYTRDVSVRVSPDYPSRYAYLINHGIPAGMLCDGAFIDGPMHSNGTISFSSSSPDSSGDPFVASVSTSLDNFYFASGGYSDVPHPEGSNIWVRPYNRHIQGTPYWETGADSLDFDLMFTWFRELQDEAAAQGGIIYNASRIIIRDNMLLIKNGIDDPVDTLITTGKDLLYFVGARPVYIKSQGSPDNVFTFVSTGSIYISGSIQGPSNPDAGIISIVSLKDIVIAEDPGFSGGSDWPNPWKIETDGNLQLDCVLAAPKGCIRAENPGIPDPALRFTIHGGTILDDFGLVGIAGRGYQLRVAWNQALTNLHPPHYPSMGDWVISSWQQDPDYNGADIDENMF